jgi:hypothetical protein
VRVMFLNFARTCSTSKDRWPRLRTFARSVAGRTISRRPSSASGKDGPGTRRGGIEQNASLLVGLAAAWAIDRRRSASANRRTRTRKELESLNVVERGLVGVPTASLPYELAHVVAS